VVSSTPRPHFTPGKDPVPILQEAGWAPWPVWTGGKSNSHRDSIPDRPARSQSLFQCNVVLRNIYQTNQTNNCCTCLYLLSVRAQISECCTFNFLLQYFSTVFWSTSGRFYKNIHGKER